MSVAAETTVGVNFAVQVQEALAKLSSLDQALTGVAGTVQSLGIVAGLYFVGKKISEALEGLVNAGAKTELQLATLQSSFVGIAESGQEAQAALVEYNRAVLFAAQTPFDVEGVVDAAVYLRAVGIDPLTNSFRNLRGQQVSALTVLGNTARTAQEFSDVLRALYNTLS